MASESNMGFNQDSFLASALNRHAISFQSGAINSTTGMIHLGSSVAVTSTAGMMLPGNSSIITNTPGMNPAGSPSGSILDSVSGMKHETGFSVEWSIEEQCKLEEGLVKYAKETSIMRYIKIAATLHDKTVRDVALRCRWITKKETGKRRKPEDHNMGKKMKDRKEKIVETSSKPNIPSVPMLNMSTYSLMMNQMDQNDQLSCEVSGVEGATKHLLDENTHVFSQILSNLSMHKIQDNIDLFCRTRNNITTILNTMSDMPGIMRQMPPLPISINDELANSILPNTSKTTIFGLPGGIHMKQEPRC